MAGSFVFLTFKLNHYLSLWVFINLASLRHCVSPPLDFGMTVDVILAHFIFRKSCGWYNMVLATDIARRHNLLLSSSILWFTQSFCLLFVMLAEPEIRESFVGIFIGTWSLCFDWQQLSWLAIRASRVCGYKNKCVDHCRGVCYLVMWLL